LEILVTHIKLDMNFYLWHNLLGFQDINLVNTENPIQIYGRCRDIQLSEV